MVGFSTIAQVLVEIFNAQSIVVNLCVLLFMIMFIPMNFISIKVLNSGGLRMTVPSQFYFVVIASSNVYLMWCLDENVNYS